MKVEWSMINPQLRPVGLVMKIAMPNVIVHKKTIDLPNVKNKYIERTDGTRMRMIVEDSICHRKGNERHWRDFCAKNGLDRYAACGRRPGMLWLHGGGFSVGMPEVLYTSMGRLAADRCVVVAPAYRTSGVAPYPAALLDCCSALEWMVQNADALMIDKNRIFVGGESAGGSLAAAVCLYMRDTDGVRISCQFPLYPMIDDTMSTKSMIGNNAPVWDEKKSRIAWDLYLSGVDRENVPIYAAPYRARDLSCLPPAVTFVGSLEPFCDETVNYMQRLKACGVPVMFKIYKGCYHAFDMMAAYSSPARDARKFFCKALDTAILKYACKP